MSEKRRSTEKQDAPRRKPHLKYDRKPLNKNNRNSKLAIRRPEAQFPEASKHLRAKENQSSILHADMSVIEGSSFTSNKHDHSMDSINKILIGDNPNDDKESQETSKYSGAEVDLTAIHREYEELIGRSRLLGADEDDDEDEAGRVLPEEEEWNLKEEKPPEKPSHSISPMRTRNEALRKLAAMKSQIQEMRRRPQDISTSMNMGNLSAIHEEREGAFPSEVGAEKEEEEVLINFVSRHDPEQRQKNEKRELDPHGDLEEESEEDEWDDRNPMLVELDLEIEKEKGGPLPKNKSNYPHVLEELNSKGEVEFSGEEPEDCKLEQVLRAREKWVNSHDRTQEWKDRQLALLQFMREVWRNPCYEPIEERE